MPRTKRKVTKRARTIKRVRKHLGTFVKIVAGIFVAYEGSRAYTNYRTYRKLRKEMEQHKKETVRQCKRANIPENIAQLLWGIMFPVCGRLNFSEDAQGRDGKSVSHRRRHSV